MAVKEPIIIDIRNQIPHANQGYEKKRALSRITHLAVHYDAVNRPGGAYDPIARYIGQARYHIQKDWNPGGSFVPGFSLMYALRISWDGRIWWTQNFELITWHVSNANPFSLAICLDCGANQQPTPAQLVSLADVLNWLDADPRLPVTRERVMGHLEFRAWGANTNCPGAILPYVQKYRAGKWGLPDQPVIPEPPIVLPEPRPEIEFFEPTGFTVAGGFLDLYRKSKKLWGDGGQLSTAVGYPISFERKEGDLTVQYFENTRMEWKPGIQARFGAAGRIALNAIGGV